MVKYKFIYFNGRGLGELSRYIFAIANQDYDDHRIDDFNEWLILKNDTIFGQLPILIINDNEKETKLAQSGTIARYLARKFGLAGRDELEQAKAEMVIDHFVDLVPPFRDAVMEHEDALRDQKFKKFSDLLPNHFAALEKILETQKTPYMAGNDLTVGDLSIAVNFDRFGKYMDNFKERFPLLYSIVEKVNSLPKLAEYKARRPVTEY